MLGPIGLAVLEVYSSWARKGQLAQMAAPHFLHELARSHSPGRRLLKNIMLVLALAAAGLPAIHYTSYHEIAAVMKPKEIHPEVRQKLDAIVRAFGK